MAKLGNHFAYSLFLSCLLMIAAACDEGKDSTTADARALDAAPRDASTDGTSTSDAPLSSPDSAVADAAKAITGESCDSPIPLSSGTKTYAFTATALDHLDAKKLFDAECISAEVLKGPDITFAYQATFTGIVTITVKAKSDFAGGMFRMAAVLTDDPCASPVLDQHGGCASQYAETPSVTVHVSVVKGATYYLHVAKTDSSPNTFADHQVEITVSES
jgi:hypothetical protein